MLCQLSTWCMHCQATSKMHEGQRSEGALQGAKHCVTARQLDFRRSYQLKRCQLTVRTAAPAATTAIRSSTLPHQQCREHEASFVHQPTEADQ